MTRYQIALWVRPDSSGADFADELSEELITVICREASLDTSGEVALSALLALMVRAGVRQAYAGAVQATHEISRTWFSQVDLALWTRCCSSGCVAGHAVCPEGRRLYAEAHRLFSLLPDRLPDCLSAEQRNHLQAFSQVGDAYLAHIGMRTLDRRF